MATNQPRERERAGLLRGADATEAQAERGQPEAEHGLYGMVRKGSAAAKDLSERQIRGVESTTEKTTEKATEKPAEKLAQKPPAP